MPSDPSAPIKQVAAGHADLAISYEPEVMIAREQGLDVVAVGALVDEPLTSLISLPVAGIDEPATSRGDDRDRRDPLPVRVPGDDPGRGGLSPDDVEQVNVGLNLLPALLCGRADAMLGGFRNIEGVDLAERGEDPSVVPVDELGIPTYDELRAGRERATASQTTPRRSASSSTRSRAAPRAASPTPQRPPRRCSPPARASTRS